MKQIWKVEKLRTNRLFRQVSQFCIPKRGQQIQQIIKAEKNRREKNLVRELEKSLPLEKSHHYIIDYLFPEISTLEPIEEPDIQDIKFIKKPDILQAIISKGLKRLSRAQRDIDIEIRQKIWNRIRDITGTIEITSIKDNIRKETTIRLGLNDLDLSLSILQDGKKKIIKDDMVSLYLTENFLLQRQWTKAIEILQELPHNTQRYLDWSKRILANNTRFNTFFAP